MKIVCKSATQVPGRGIVAKGQHIDWPDGVPFPPQVAANFTLMGGEPLVQPETDGGEQLPLIPDAKEQERAEKLAKEALVANMAKLGKEKLQAALDNAGVPYGAKATNTELAKALLRAQGQDVD